MSTPPLQIDTKTTETIPWHKRRPWGAKFIKVVNQSNYPLVITFVHEHRLHLTSQEKTTKRNVTAGASAGVGLDCLVEGKADLRFSFEEVNNMSFETGDCVVSKNKTVGVGGKCKVDFLPGCEEMRVRGYYLLPIGHDPKPLAFWKDTIYGRSVRITATLTKQLSMEVNPKAVEVGLLEELPVRSVLLVAIGGVMLSVGAYIVARAVR